MTEWVRHRPWWRSFSRWHTTSGRWEVRFVKIDKWHRAWILWDRVKRRQGVISHWPTPGAAKEYLEQQYRPRRRE